jgi:hypothetical protein
LEVPAKDVALEGGRVGCAALEVCEVHPKVIGEALKAGKLCGCLVAAHSSFNAQ